MQHVQNKKNCDLRVELLRITACLIVIGTHIKPGLDTTHRVFLGCLLGDGVSIFWLITGFFIFNNKSYAKVLLKAFTRVGIPALVVMMLSSLLNDWVHNSSMVFSLHDSLAKTDWHDIFYHVRFKSAGMKNGFHLWYIYAYMENILWFPLLKGICSDENKKQGLLIIALGCLALIIADLQKIKNVSYISCYNVLDASKLLIVIGFYFYSFCARRIKGHKYLSVLSIAAWLLLNVIRAQLQVSTSNPELYFLYWNTGFGVCGAVLLSICFLSIDLDGVGDRLETILMKMGRNTFYVYLIHVLVYEKLYATGIAVRIRELVSGFLSAPFASDIVYVILYTISIFMVSSLIIESIRCLCRLIMQFQRVLFKR